MISQRSSGILLHPTSLPSRGGIGDFGPAAYQFIDWLASAKQTLWQILPIGPLGYGNSPYSCTSAFAGNVLLISTERLAERGLLQRDRPFALADDDSPVDYERVKADKLPLLREAADRFLQYASGEPRERFDTFCKQNNWWLDDYVLFSALREKYAEQAWHSWPEEIVVRDATAIAEVTAELRTELDRERFLQFAFYEQWSALRSYCAGCGVRIVGDIAIFVSYDSADVWTHPENFRLRPDLLPDVVAGVPPDAYSETGQRWGNPLYDWDTMKDTGYAWWIKRIDWAVRAYDIVRLDHFRGFEAYWEIPADETTAVNGHWVLGPNEDLFIALRNALGKLPFIAEDLGHITKEVHTLRKKLGVPGMKVMQFGFGDRGAHIYLPHKYEPNSVVYTGTHDNDTTLGWWKTAATPEEKKLASAYLGITSEDEVAWAFVRGALTSVANLVITPVQDVLGLDGDARMNTPSKTDGNWSWRLRSRALTPELGSRLAMLVEVTDRDLPKQPVRETEPAKDGFSA